MADIRNLAQRTQDVHDRYQREFANKSRITRDLSRLDGMIATLEGVLLEANTDPGGAASLLPTVRSRLELYRGERESIAQAKAGGPEEATAHRLSEWNWLNTQRYRRNFAGQNRVTRDLGLLLEMHTEQKGWHAELSEAAKNKPAGWRSELIEQLGKDAELYGREATAIRDARAGLASDRKVGMLATTANTQFGLWREHFANKSRAARRLPLVDRMIVQLRDILAQMQQLPAGDVNAGNIRKVEDRIETWNNERSLIEKAIAQAGPETVSGRLATEANAEFGRYRENFAGKSRATVDAALLGSVCECLHEIARNMDTLDRTWKLQQNAANLEIVLENLKTYEREYSQIRAAQEPKVN